MEEYPHSKSYGQANDALKGFLAAIEGVITQLPEDWTCREKMREEIRQSHTKLLRKFDDCLVSLGYCCGCIPDPCPAQEPLAAHAPECHGLSMYGVVVLKAMTGVLATLAPLLSFDAPNAEEKLSNDFAIRTAAGQLKALQESLK